MNRVVCRPDQFPEGVLWRIKGLDANSVGESDVGHIGVHLYSTGGLWHDAIIFGATLQVAVWLKWISLARCCRPIDACCVTGLDLELDVGRVHNANTDVILLLMVSVTVQCRGPVTGILTTSLIAM